MKKLLLSLSLLALAAPALAANTQAIPSATRERMLEGLFEVPASACSGADAPSDCCTGLGAGATCPVYKLALVTSSGTYSASSTTFSGANEISCTGYVAGGATVTATSAANYVQTDGDNDSCVHFTTPVTWSGTSCSGANAPNAAILYCESNCTAGDNTIVGVYCLDGSTCATDKPSSGGDTVVNLANTVGAAMYCITD